MQQKTRYRKKSDRTVIAIQLNLDTPGFNYEKWGSTQSCCAGDWIVDNDGDIYTVSNDSFAKTYDRIGPGTYIKTAFVWAAQAEENGNIRTNEGATDYLEGDYIVFNDEDETDGYAVAQSKFEEMYEPDNEFNSDQTTLESVQYR